MDDVKVYYSKKWQSWVLLDNKVTVGAYDTEQDALKAMAAYVGPHLNEAYQKGVQAALSVTVGQSFRGAMPAARELYPDGSLEYGCFVSGFVNTMKKHDVFINPDNGLVTGFYDKRSN